MYAKTQSETFPALFINLHPPPLQPERPCIVLCLGSAKPPSDGVVQAFSQRRLAPVTGTSPLFPQRALPHIPLCWFKCDLIFWSLGVPSISSHSLIFFCCFVKKPPQAKSDFSWRNGFVCTFLLRFLTLPWPSPHLPNGCLTGL